MPIRLSKIVFPQLKIVFHIVIIFSLNTIQMSLFYFDIVKSTFVSSLYLLICICICQSMSHHLTKPRTEGKPQIWYTHHIQPQSISNMYFVSIALRAARLKKLPLHEDFRIYFDCFVGKKIHRIN